VAENPIDNQSPNILEDLRNRLLTIASGVIFGFGIFSALASFWAEDPNRFWHFGALILLGAAFIAKPLGRRIRFGFLFLAIFGVGVQELWVEGATGLSHTLFLLAIFFSVTLIGLKSGIVTLILSELSTVLIAYLIINGHVQISEYKFESSDHWGSWIHIPIILMLGGSLIIASTNFLVTRLQNSLNQAHDLLGELRTSIEQKDQAEISLKKSEDQYQLLAENVYDVVWMLDMDMNTTYVSPSMLAQRGISADEALGQKLEESVVPEYLPLLLEALGEQLALEELDDADPGRSVTLEYEVFKQDGSPTWVESVMTFLRDADGHPTHIVGSTRDISSRKEAEKEKNLMQLQIQQAQKLESLGVMAGGIAHDFNNLLLGVIGNADIALLNIDPDDKNHPYLKDIMASAQRAADLCSQLLAYSGKGRFVVQPIDLSELVYEMTHLLDVSIDKKVEVKYEIDDALPAIEADVTQMQQIIMNLVLNASDAIGGEAGVITIAIQKQHFAKNEINLLLNMKDMDAGDYLVFECRDSGGGMDTFTKERIFDPFYSTKGLGHGLGLAAVVGIVQGHGGGMTVDSKVGKGTTIKIVLPVSERKAVSIKLDSGSKVESSGSGTILVVDDEPMILTFAKQAMEKLGYRVLVAENGKIAVDICKDHMDDIDLVLLDMTMPVMDGKETYEELSKLNPEIKVIVSSGFNEEETISQFAGKETVRFIQKPYRVAALQDVVNQSLKQAHEL
jgi:PAS domain S-box-containing protein